MSAGKGGSTNDIGAARVALIHAAGAGGQLLDALDADSGDLEALFDVFFDGASIKEDFFAGKGSDLMYVGDLTVEPGWRNRNIELAVVRRLCDTLGSGCELAVIPYCRSEEAAFWGRMGFEVTVSEHLPDAPRFLHLRLAFRQPKIVEADQEGRFKVVPNLFTVKGGRRPHWSVDDPQTIRGRSAGPDTRVATARSCRRSSRAVRTRAARDPAAPPRPASSKLDRCHVHVHERLPGHRQTRVRGRAVAA